MPNVAIKPESADRRTLKALRIKTVKDKTGLAESTIYKLGSEGKFPKPFRLSDGSGGAAAWLEHEIDDWIDERAARRFAASPSGERLAATIEEVGEAKRTGDFRPLLRTDARPK
jgi:prophage regulatory protein